MISYLKKNFVIGLLVLAFGISLVSRFFYLDFGLPYVFQADEVEMVEYSLKYSLNIKKIFTGDLYFFKPFSFVYGTLPAYFNSILLMFFLKFTSVFSLSQDRYYIYLYLRIIYAVFSVLTCIGVYFLSNELVKDKKTSLLAAIFFSLSFYFYWLGKYLNNDVLVVLFTVYFLIFYLRFKETGKSRNFLLACLFLGFGISTKITFGITLIYPLFELLIKREFKKVIFMVGIIFGIYFITNPFTFIYPQEFISRIMEMRVKENGIVIDSYNTSYSKYLISLSENITILIVLFSFIYIIKNLLEKKLDITIFIAIFYFIFFTFSSRLVPRWVLPIYPLLIIYAFKVNSQIKSNIVKLLFIFLIFSEIIFGFLISNYELSQNSNFLKSYYFVKEIVKEKSSNIYVVTQSGLNPFTSMESADIHVFSGQFIPYVSENAFEIFPLNPANYDLIVFSSKVRDYYQNPFIKEINPQYSEKWESFYRELNSDKYEKLADFGSPFSFMIQQENVSIFKRK